MAKEMKKASDHYDFSSREKARKYAISVGSKVTDLGSCSAPRWRVYKKAEAKTETKPATKAKPGKESTKSTVFKAGVKVRVKAEALKAKTSGCGWNDGMDKITAEHVGKIQSGSVDVDWNIKFPVTTCWFNQDFLILVEDEAATVAAKTEKAEIKPVVADKPDEEPVKKGDELEFVLPDELKKAEEVKEAEEVSVDKTKDVAKIVAALQLIQTSVGVIIDELLKA